MNLGKETHGDVKNRDGRGQMLTFGCLWFRTMASSWPSGEKAGTKAPLDLTGWQVGVRWDMGYVLVAHCMLYPTDLQRKLWFCFAIVISSESPDCYIDPLTHPTLMLPSSHWIFKQVIISFFPDVKTRADKQASPTAWESFERDTIWFKALIKLELDGRSVK